MNGGIGRRSTGCDSHYNILAEIFDERFGDDFPRHGAVSDGVIGTDTFSAVDMEGADPGKLRDFKEVGGIGRIPSTND